MKRMVLRGTVVALVLLVAGCAGTPPAPPEPKLFDRLTITGDTLGWGGLRLGMTKSRIETFLDDEITPRQSESPACGEMYADFKLHGRSVTAQFTEKSGGMENDSYYIPFNEEEKKLSMRQLASELLIAVPPLIAREGRHGPSEGISGFFVLKSNEDAAILLKPGNGFYISKTGCVD